MTKDFRKTIGSEISAELSIIFPIRVKWSEDFRPATVQDLLGSSRFQIIFEKRFTIGGVGGYFAGIDKPRRS